MRNKFKIGDKVEIITRSPTSLDIISRMLDLPKPLRGVIGAENPTQYRVDGIDNKRRFKKGGEWWLWVHTHQVRKYGT